MGTNDLAKETRARLRARPRPHAAVADAGAGGGPRPGLDILDGVYNDIADADGFEAECEQGRDLGFDGKTLIHPSQVEPANEIFAPAADEVERARKVIAAFEQPENAGKGAISLDGRMVERLHADIGRRTVAMADAIAARG